MLKNDVFYNLSFRLRDIDLNNINDIYFAINIIIIIATTLLEALIADIFILKLIIVIIFNVDIVIVIIVIFEKSVFKLITFDFNIKKRLIMNISFNQF